MDHFLGYLGFVAIDTAVEKKQNQLTFDNFIVRSRENDILTYKKDWKGEKVTKTTLTMDGYYLILYDCLVSTGIIDKVIDRWSVVTWNSKYTITKDANKIKSDYIKETVEKGNCTDFPELIERFDIDFDKLSKLLKEYIYDPTAQLDIINPVKKGGKRNKGRRTKRRLSRKK